MSILINNQYYTLQPITDGLLAYYNKKINEKIYAERNSIGDFLNSLPEMSEECKASAINAFILSGRDKEIDPVERLEMENSLFGVKLLVQLLIPTAPLKKITNKNKHEILKSIHDEILNPGLGMIRDVIRIRKEQQNATTSSIDTNRHSTDVSS